MLPKVEVVKDTVHFVFISNTLALQSAFGVLSIDQLTAKTYFQALRKLKQKTEIIEVSIVSRHTCGCRPQTPHFFGTQHVQLDHRDNQKEISLMP